MPTSLIAGGAGFIGSHMACKLLDRDPDNRVVIYDNFSSGRAWHLPAAPRLEVVRGDLKDLPALKAALEGVHTVFHFASNPDIAKAATQPDIDFWEGTYLTQNLLEAMRQTGVSRLIYASGSGVYGETGETAVDEDFSPLLPISTYGASKLACEALMTAYSHMFGIRGAAFRFANVVGPRQTHGVAYDFIRRLIRQPDHLAILGDGRQSKSYIHVDDVLNALLLIHDQQLENLQVPGYDVFNVATQDYLTVREIADLVVARLGLKDVKYQFAGGDRGWKGDVPIVRFNSDKIRARGWTNRRTSTEAMTHAIDSMANDALAGKFDH